MSAQLKLDVPVHPGFDTAPAVTIADDEHTRLVRELEHHQREIAQKPGDVETILRAAQFCAKVGQANEASSLFLAAIKIAPDRIEATLGMAELLRGQAMHGEAVDLLKDAITRTPGVSGLWTALAAVMTDLDDAAHAFTFFDEALRLDENDANARLQRAIYFMKIGRLHDALGDFEHVRNVDRYDARALIGCGDVQAMIGGRNEARLLYTAALGIVKNSKDIDDRLERLAITAFRRDLPRTHVQSSPAAQDASAQTLSIVFFHVDIENGTASPFEKPDYHAMLAKSIAVARAKAPRASIVVLSDTKTRFAATLGADRIVRGPVDADRLMFERMRMERDFLAGADPHSNIVFADSDLIVNRDPAELFDGSFDVALTWRSDLLDSPFNGGVALYRQTPGAVRFYDNLIATHRAMEDFPAVTAYFPQGMARWWGHQLAMAATVGWDDFARRRSEWMIVDGASIRFFPERTHNFAMTRTSGPLAAAHDHRFFLHFKGMRKDAFWGYANQLTLDAAPAAAPVAAAAPQIAAAPAAAAPVFDPADAADPRRSTYDLDVAPISYDVVSFLALAKNRGIKHIDIVPGEHFGFRDDGWYQKADVAEKHFRLWNIVVPACQLAGMTVAVHGDRSKAVRTLYRPEPLYVEGIREDVFHASEHARRWARRWLAKRGLTRPVVITLRESHWPSRNSNMDAWRRFAEETNAVVVPDSDGGTEFGHVFDGINMDRRLALYEEAQVNMGANGGPLSLCFLTRRIPYLMFKLVSDYPASTPEAYARRGFPVGSQFKWAGPNQRLVWADDDYETIRNAYDAFRARSGL